MAISTVDSDLVVRGALTVTTLNVPSGTLTNAGVASNAAIAATKQQHQYVKHISQESDTTSADATYVVHTVYGTSGTIVAFEAGSVTACTGNATIDVDLLVAGSSVLSAAITLDSGNSARVVEAGTISSASLSDGDVLEVSVDATVGTGSLGNGVFASLVIREDAA